MCSIPEYALNFEVKDLPRRTEESGIHRALEYACRSWYKHLLMKKYQILNIISALQDFLKHKLLFWLEVLSVLGVVGDAAHALSATVGWLNEVCLNCLFDCDVA